MKTVKLLFVLIGIILLSGFLHISIQDAGANEIVMRMKERLPQINALKDQGIIGESKSGYLEFVKPSPAHASLIAEENADRKKAYADIAAQQNVSVSVVGQHRAVQLIERAEPGHWVQDSAGRWYQK